MKKLIFDKRSACLITDRLIRSYLTGLDIAEGVYVETEEMVFFTDARYFFEVKDALKSKGVIPKLLTSMDDVKDYLIGFGCEKLYVDYTRTTVEEFFKYQKWGFEISDISEELNKKRSIKTESEIALIKESCEIAEKAYYQAIDGVYEGMTEKQLRDAIELNVKNLGGEIAFDTIVAFGSNSALPHHETDDTKLILNSPILVDMGAKKSGYMSDVTRTAFFGQPSEKFLSCYDSVLKANLTAIQKTTENTLTDVADSFARDLLKEGGLDEYFTHSLGHGVGLEIHEYPTLSKRMSVPLKNKMVFTIEPGVYFDGEFGIRIEDTVLLTDGKVERLFTDDKKLLIIKK